MTTVNGTPRLAKDEKLAWAERMSRPGVYVNVPFDVYVMIEAVNHSRLKHMATSPAHYKAALEGFLDQGDSEAKSLGTAVHVAVLEPERWAARKIVPDFSTSPDGGLRKKADKERHAQWMAEHADDLVVTADEDEIADACERAVKAHPIARQLVGAEGPTEVVIVWLDPKLGLCKCRIDKLGAFMLDLKSTRSPILREFQRDAWNFGYFTAAAFYTRGLRWVQEKLSEFIDVSTDTFGIIAVDPKLAFALSEMGESGKAAVQVYEMPLDEDPLKVAAALVDEWIDTAHRCDKAGKWPGPADDHVLKLYPPEWVDKAFATGGV